MPLRLITTHPSSDPADLPPIRHGRCIESGPRIGSLCSGIGGLDIGVRDVLGGTVAWQAEPDSAAARVLAQRWPSTPNVGDITTVDWAAVPRVDVLTAGYPCQPVSAIGRRKGAADARYLWPYIAEAVRVLEPECVVLENVRGHVSLGCDRVVGDLAGLGYDTRWMCLRASDIGAPHRRDRLFILAVPTTGRSSAGAAAADTDREPGQRAGDVDDLAGAPAQPDLEGENTAAVDPGAADVDRWGPFAVAIHRWEQRLGRPAPEPSELTARGRRRLSAAFVEWLMGLPPGYVTDMPGLLRDRQLRLLGNCVVPQQAAAAIRHLLQATPPTALEARAERADADDRQDDGSGLGVAA